MKRTVPLLIIIACIITMWFIYGKVMNETKTAVAASGIYEDTISGQALIIRREHTVKAGTNGFFQNNVPSGCKVSKYQNIGSFYKGTPDKDIVNKLNLINEKLREATLSNGTDDILTNDTVSIDNRIAQYTEKISALAAEGRQIEINKIRHEIDLLLERKQNIANNLTGGKNKAVATLTAQKEELESKLGSQKDDMYSPASGIFIIGADGMEETLTPNAVSTITPGTVQNILDQKEYKVDTEIYPYPVCKVVDNSEWILAVMCDQKKASDLVENKEIKVRFSDEGSQEVNCTLSKISMPQNGKVILFIKGTVEYDNLYNNRKVSVSVILSSYKGLKIPASALLNEEGADIVHVIKGNIESSKHVQVLYKNEELAIIKEENSKKDSLLLYEEVVLQ